MAASALLLAVLVAVASFAVSFTGLIAAAGWAGIPRPLRPAVPIVVDLSILVFTVAAVVARARGEGVRLAWSSVGFFTVVSMITNATHALSDGNSTATTLPALVVGSFIASLMPLACLISTHTAVSVAVAPPQGSNAARRRAERARVDRSATATAEISPAPPVAAMSSPHKSPVLKAATDSSRPVDVDAVVEMKQAGKSHREIADTLGTSKSTVQRLLSKSVVA
ncbi:hypothetical protein GCM10009689_18580 [Brevibacterium antiquum]|uniref:DUF2637 domain-containing protein n=1 Tax=Brevibacterium antiquum TaxID=234835 RepID=UPI0018E01EC9